MVTMIYEVSVVVVEVYTDIVGRGYMRGFIRLSISGVDQSTGQIRVGWELPAPRHTGPADGGGCYDPVGTYSQRGGVSRGEQFFSSGRGGGGGDGRGGAGQDWRRDGRFKSRVEYLESRVAEQFKMRRMEDKGTTWKRRQDGKGMGAA